MSQIPAGVVLYRPDIAVLARLLGPLAQAGRAIFIFINGTLDPAGQALLADTEGARVIASAENIGLGAGLNAISEAAATEGFSHLMLFDQDSEPSADLPEALLARWAGQTARSDTKDGPRIACVAPLLVPPKGEGYREIRYFWRDQPPASSFAPAMAPVAFAPTSGSLISLAAFRAVGPFRADFFIGGIDVEWGFRACGRGYASLVARDLTMPHRWGEPGAANRPQFLRQSGARGYFYIRNAVYCLRLAYIPRAWRLRSAAVMLAQTALLCLRGPDRRANLALIAAGLRDGIAGRLGPIPPTLVPAPLETHHR